MQQWSQLSPWIAGIGILVMLLFMFKLAKSTDLIKDLSIQIPRPYSLASSQLFWWTVIILSCFIYKGVMDKSLPKLNSLALLLLGISAATTLSGKVIDNTDRNSVGNNRHQDQAPSRNFLHDILSDAQGNYSIHRLQTFLFNVIIGIIYLVEFIHTGNFPDWDSAQVSALLGISDAGYIAIKNTENTASTLSTPPGGGPAPIAVLPPAGGQPAGGLPPVPAPMPNPDLAANVPIVNMPAETIVSATE